MRSRQIPAAQQVADAPPQKIQTSPEASSAIRAKLRRWQEENGKDLEELYKDQNLKEDVVDDDLRNLTRMSDVDKDSFTRRSEEQDYEQQAIAHFARAQAEDLEEDATDPRFLYMGDLVELEFPSSERSSLLAVYIRRNGPVSLFYTIQGRWLYVAERQIQYLLPGWVSPSLVEPLIEYLPSDEQLDDPEALQREAYVEDLSVPRHVAAPLVSRLVKFHRESLEIYRKHASTLDRAHDILAHPHDLRYGSLVSAASKLLGTPSNELPATALFTVRKALMHAGFGFNVDRRSHRVTGYIQIRSKDQVRMVEQVRTWMREWQDDLATMASMNPKQRLRHKRSKGAAIVSKFIEQAKEIVLKSREDREPTKFGNVGPSKVKREIKPDQDAVEITSESRFSEGEQELVRFMEAWACNNMFLGLPRINALPPLILQATGLYEDHGLDKWTGYVFLQELGTILPYENRVRFDQHLLLPSSQHSKPLQNLMNGIIGMESNPGFTDSMADIRHDWGDLPVYCIDDAGAQEIDDGISVERANHEDSDKPEWWVHVHIANPTAFFDRDHPLAKMARHMGETIYNPERTYMMLPRWSTQRHFSLAKNRPCLTFSARLDTKGRTLEKKIRAGTIRNVHRITPDEVNQLTGLKRDSTEKIELLVGGRPPPAKERASAIPNMTSANVEDLKMFQRLAEKRQDLRKAAGGVFFDSHKPETNVWQNWRYPGLAWDHPYRRGSRTVKGDPVIRMRTRPLINWFAAGHNMDILVREMMLLACEVSTAWCAERAIPTIYRGSVPKPDQSDPKAFFDNVCLPAMQKNNGEMPMHIGIEYIRNMGSVTLSTKPLAHKLLGLESYGKVTSPLRRYGDMILHWQIEAALREEARTGKTLITSGATLSGTTPNRDFLPFSASNLQTIMTGLHPREGMITRAKNYAEAFWQNMLLFRAHHYGEAKLPFETCRVYLPSKPWAMKQNVYAIIEDINMPCEMLPPEKAAGMPEPQAGDSWECTLESVNVFARMPLLKPFRLVSRFE